MVGVNLVRRRHPPLPVGLVETVVVGGRLVTTTLSTTTWPFAASDCSCTTTEHNHWWREPQATSSEQEHFKKARFCTTTASSRGATTATTGYSSRFTLLSKEALTKSTKEPSPSESLGLDPASKNSASGGHGRGSVSSWRSPSAPASGVGRQCHDAPHLGLGRVGSFTLRRPRPREARGTSTEDSRAAWRTSGSASAFP